MAGTNEEENKMKAGAVSEFVNMMIGAFESGFVDKNNPTLSEIFRVAQNHIADNYGVKTHNIDVVWGREIAEQCGLRPLQCFEGGDSKTCECPDHGRTLT